MLRVQTRTLVWPQMLTHSQRLSLTLIKPAQIFLESRQRLSLLLAQGDDSRLELKTTLMRANSQQLSSSFDLGLSVHYFYTRSEFQRGSISLAQLANKVTATVGVGISSLSYDLYEAKASEKKTELQTILFRLADTVSDLTEQLKGK